jgi:hypothetical protein
LARECYTHRHSQQRAARHARPILHRRADREQATLRDEIAAGESTTPEKLLPELIAHGLAMIAAGINQDDLHAPYPSDAVFRSVLPAKPSKRRPRKPAGTGELDDDIPF